MAAKNTKTGGKNNKKKKVDSSTTNTSSLSSTAAPSSFIAPAPNSPLNLNVPSPMTPVVMDQKKFEELIRHTQLEFAKVKNSFVKEKKKEIESLETQVKEYMNQFMLIGYDLNGNPVEMVSASNTAEYDSLLERFRRVMYKINQNVANSNGEDPYGHNN